VYGSRETSDDAPPEPSPRAEDDELTLNQFGASPVLAPREQLELRGS
jgi:hypothetical protein